MRVVLEWEQESNRRHWHDRGNSGGTRLVHVPRDKHATASSPSDVLFYSSFLPYYHNSFLKPGYRRILGADNAREGPYSVTPNAFHQDLDSNYPCPAILGLQVYSPGNLNFKYTTGPHGARETCH